MNCLKSEKLIEKYVSATITETELKSVLKHTANCERCRQELATCQKIEKLVKESFPKPEDSYSEIMERIGDLPQSPRPTGMLYLRRCAALIFIVFFVGAGIFALNSRTGGKNGIIVLQSEGTSLVQKNGSGKWNQIVPGDIIYATDKVCTTGKSHLVFEVGEDSTVAMEENSMLVLQSFNGVTEFFLDSGSLKADLRSPHGPFFVTTVNGKTEALGTKFSIKTE